MTEDHHQHHQDTHLTITLELKGAHHSILPLLLHQEPHIHTQVQVATDDHLDHLLPLTMLQCHILHRHTKNPGVLQHKCTVIQSLLQEHHHIPLECILTRCLFPVTMTDTHHNVHSHHDHEDHLLEDDHVHLHEDDPHDEPLQDVHHQDELLLEDPPFVERDLLLLEKTALEVGLQKLNQEEVEVDLQSLSDISLIELFNCFQARKIILIQFCYHTKNHYH